MKKENYIPALSYERLTPLYDPVVRLTTREGAFKKVLLDQSRLESARRVLDLACGTGTLTVMIKRASPEAEVVGIDGDPKILRIAESKAKRSGTKISFKEGMSFDLPFPDGAFDLVFSSLFFHHLTRENKLKTLREVFRVLTPEGELQIADWGHPANFAMKIASRAIMMLDGSETTGDNFDGLLPSLITETGFREVGETTHFNSLFGTIRLLKVKK